MTGEQLRAELERIAEGAPRVDIPSDLYARGRRSTARARILTAGAAVACIALLVAVVVPALQTDRIPVVDEPGTGIPDRIYGPPDGVVDLPITPLDDVGPVAASYAVDPNKDELVLVTVRGEYVAVRLPGLTDPYTSDTLQQLSPDGRQLAYVADRDGRRGIVVVDLTTGATRDVSLSGPLGAAPLSLQWSPDSTWLAWSGQEITFLSTARTSYAEAAVAGLIGPDATSSAPLPGGDRWRQPGICVDGAAVRADRSGYLARTSSTDEPTRDWADLVARHGACTPPLSDLPAEVDLPTRALGWFPAASPDVRPRPAVLQPAWLDDSEGSFTHWNVQSPGDEDGVVHFESGWIEHPSVAVGLLAGPTIPASEDPWARPWWESHPVPLLVGVVVGGAVLTVLLGTVRRRFSSR